MQCPRCNGQIVTDKRTQERGCLACGYEYIESTPIGLNADHWTSRVSLPVYGTRKEVPEKGRAKQR